MCQSCDCVADALQWLGEGGGRKEREGREREGGKGREREDSERGWEEREGGRREREGGERERARERGKRYDLGGNTHSLIVPCSHKFNKGFNNGRRKEKGNNITIKEVEEA